MCSVWQPWLCSGSLITVQLEFSAVVVMLFPFEAACRLLSWSGLPTRRAQQAGVV